MNFPAWIEVFGLRLHPHAVAEFTAYATAGWLWRRAARREGMLPALGIERSAMLWLGAIFGAIAGAKLLAWAEHWPQLVASTATFADWYGGKTVVGGLLGGWVGVVLAKRSMGIARVRTGDVAVGPMCAGIAIGRLGCFLTGLADGTHGTHSDLPWAVDFGDGPRHPTQLYEMIVTLGLGLACTAWRSLARVAGARWLLAIGGYLLWRVLVDALKPHVYTIAGLTPIQWAALGGSVYAFISLARVLRAAAAPLPPSSTAEVTA